jgi:hypothetical protein
LAGSFSTSVYIAGRAWLFLPQVAYLSA